MSTPVGLVGIGNMGLAMALRLRDLGREVRVRDLDAAREATAGAHGARIAATPAALAAQCGLVIVAVVDAAQSEAVLFGPAGAASALPPGGCVMLCPTIAPASTEAIGSRLAALGIDCIDAPMSGGPARARDGTMSLMVACADAVFERHRDVVGALSAHVFRLGARVGDGARTKLVNNLLAAVNLAGAAEALALAARLGLDPARTQAVIERSSGQSWIGTDRMRRALVGDFAPRAHTTLLQKDSGLAVAMAEAAGFEAALGRQAAAVFAQACASGCGGLDDASLLPFLRAQGGFAVDARLPLEAPVARTSPPDAEVAVQRGARGSPDAPSSLDASPSLDPSSSVVPNPSLDAPPSLDPPSSPVARRSLDPHPSLDAPTASAYADCALHSLAERYPYALQRLMRNADDRPAPDDVHPIFSGSYDWHSSVHMHWALVRLLRLVPGLTQRDAIVDRFARRFTAAAAARELAHLQSDPGFERPYGWGWLMQLQRELRAAAPLHAASAEWADALEPMIRLLRRRWIEHLGLVQYPQRTGVHSNSAFAMTLALAHAEARDDLAFADALRCAARRWFGGDLCYPAHYEPSANDFLSGGLCEAVLMSGVLPDNAEFARWWRAFAPVGAAMARWLEPVVPSSRTDAQLVHADGLNLSRGWCFGALAERLPEEQPRFAAARDAHLRAALPHVTGGAFVATHWLVSFALLGLTGV